MALIELFHVVADEMPVGASEILEGSLVTLDLTTGLVIPATATSWVYGIAGDTKSDSTASLPTTNGATIGASDVSSAFVNRVSDSFDETKASAKMTVYHAGGKFATNQYLDSDTFTPGLPVYSNAAGLFTVTDGGGTLVGHVLEFGDFPSGVPGVDVDGDITLGNFLTVKLCI